MNVLADWTGFHPLQCPGSGGAKTLAVMANAKGLEVAGGVQPDVPRFAGRWHTHTAGYNEPQGAFLPSVLY
jgi:hypothetical protein